MICAAILSKYLSSINITSIQILDDRTKKCNVDKLVTALYWCKAHGISLINLSVGSVNFRGTEKISKCIADITSSGILIVAAISNENIFTLPACLSDVIGVRSSSVLNHGYEYCINSFLGGDILTSGSHEINISSKLLKTQNCNSFAAPYITSKVGEILQINPSLDLIGVKQILYEQADNFSSNYPYNSKYQLTLDWSRYSKYVSLFDKESNKAEIENKIGDVINLNQNIGNILNNAQDYTRKIWDINYYSKILNSEILKSQVEIDIPVLLVISSEFTAQFIRNAFRSDGYFAIYITDTINHLPFITDEIFPLNCNIKKFIEYVYGKYYCDLIVINVAISENQMEAKSVSDFNILQCQDGSFLLELSANCEVKRINVIDHLYQIIKSYLIC